MIEKFIVYQTRCKVNNKIYVGVHRTLNIDDGYLGSGVAINRAISKYGRDQFERTILYEGIDYESVLRKEAEIVDEAFIKRPDVYNIMLGGASGGRRKGSRVNDTKNYSEANRKRWANEDFKSKTALAMRKPKSVKWTQEQREAASKRRTGVEHSLASKEKMSIRWKTRAARYAFMNQLTGETFSGTTLEFVEKFGLNRASAATRFNSESGVYMNWIRRLH